jgi:hypothetical protein
MIATQSISHVENSPLTSRNGNSKKKNSKQNIEERRLVWRIFFPCKALFYQTQHLLHRSLPACLNISDLAAAAQVTAYMILPDYGIL